MATRLGADVPRVGVPLSRSEWKAEWKSGGGNFKSFRSLRRNHGVAIHAPRDPTEIS